MAVEKKFLYRTVDANFNRAKEGLRVCEDVCRFVLDQKTATREYKNIRHALTDIILSLKIQDFIQARNIEKDVGRSSTKVEFKRKGVIDIFYANSQRIKESIRVLEEFFKILNKNKAQDLKNLRYQIYAVEKKVISKL